MPEINQRDIKVGQESYTQEDIEAIDSGLQLAGTMHWVAMVHAFMAN